jgi:hypothetical protein
MYVVAHLCLASLEGGAIIDQKRFEGNLVFLRARGPASLLDRYRRFRDKQSWELLILRKQSGEADRTSESLGHQSLT